MKCHIEISVMFGDDEYTSSNTNRHDASGGFTTEEIGNLLARTIHGIVPREMLVLAHAVVNESQQHEYTNDDVDFEEISALVQAALKLIECWDGVDSKRKGSELDQIIVI